MRGRIIFVNPQTMTGLIFGVDRQRYDFELKEWSEAAPPARNLEVNFQASGNEARRIKPYSADYTDETLPDKAPRKARLDKSRKEPNLKMPSGSDQALFNDGIELPIGIDTPPLTATAGGFFKKGRPGTALPGDPGLREPIAPPRPAWQYYLMGGGACVVLVLVAYLVRLVIG